MQALTAHLGTFSVGVMPEGLGEPRGNSLFPALLRAAFQLERACRSPTSAAPARPGALDPPIQPTVGYACARPFTNHCGH